MLSANFRTNGYGCIAGGNIPNMRFLDTQILSRVVIVQTAFLGDVLLTLPMLRALKKQYPVKFLAAVVTPEAAEALSAESCVDELLLYNKRNAEKKNDAFENICREIRRRDFSCSLLPHRSFRSAYMAYRAGVKTRVGFHNSPGAWLYRSEEHTSELQSR